MLSFFLDIRDCERLVTAQSDQEMLLLNVTAKGHSELFISPPFSDLITAQNIRCYRIRKKKVIFLTIKR